MNLLRRLTLRQLEVFVEAARSLNLSRAAETLHLTQPAVSMQIRQLEDNVGLPLFERIGRGRRLTEAGERLLLHASRLLGEVRDAEQAMQALKGLAGGRVTVGLVSTAEYFAPKLLAEFSRRHPAVDVRFLVGNREALVRLLRDADIDIAVMGRPPPEVETASEPLAGNPHVLVASGRHPLVGRRHIDLHSLRGEAFLMREAGSGTRLMMEELFRTHLLRPLKLITLGSNETIKQAVIAGLGISLLSLHALGLELRAGEIAVLDVFGLPMQRIWHVVHLRARVLSPAAGAFRRFLIEHTQARLAEDFVGLPQPPIPARARAARRSASAE
ncbi:MAG: LysR family transcriptional regulator [Gammaproteobacteria bacterium]|nr:LysR family transcriptional regulator [Gammaproteobacteria bacterium]